MDRIKILVIDWASLLPPRKSVYGELCTHCWIPELLKIISETKSQSVTHRSILSMSKEKIHYFMKIKHFSQLCEQLYVNQFLHKFKENEQTCDRVK